MIKQDRIKKLIYRSWHRGCKETDILLGDFAKSSLHNLSDQEISDFEKLVEEDDALIYDVLTDKVATPDYWNKELISKIKQFQNS